jgi:hypothetical protein
MFVNSEAEGKRKMIRKIAFVMVMAAFLAACGESTSYPISAHEVTGKLLSTKPPMFVFGSSGADVMVTQGEGGAVRWTVLKDGHPVMRLVAIVTPDGDSASKVAVSVEPPSNNASARIGQNMADNPAIVKLYRSAMAEQIDAKLNNRPFNMAAIQSQMVAAAIATMPKIQQSAMQAAQSSAEMERDMKRSAADADYEREHQAAMSGYGSDNSSSSSSDSY